MEKVAATCLRSGDVTNAAKLYASLENLDPRYNRMARLCRVLCDPNSVPLPHRHNDVCESLLEPRITAEILVGNDLSMEAVQRKYQRLVILVHPDKNPHPHAKDAFLRLANMREEAKECLTRKLREKAQQEKRILREKKAMKGKVDIDSEDSVLPSLAELKNNKISLKSLKRIDIEDNFEMFSSPHGRRKRRGERYNPFDLDEDFSEWSLENSMSSTSTYPSQKSNRRKSSVLNNSSQKLPTANSSSTSSINPHPPIPKRKVDLDSALEEARQYIREEEERAKQDEALALQKDEEGNDLLLIRNQICFLIDHIEDCKRNKLELKTDLRYSSYLREKKIGPRPCFEVVELQ